MTIAEALANPEHLRLFLEGAIEVQGGDPSDSPSRRFAFAYANTVDELLKLEWRSAAAECLRGELGSWSDAAVFELLEVVQTCTPPGALTLLERKVGGAALARRAFQGHSLQLQAASVAVTMELTDWLRDWLSSALVRQPHADVVMLCLTAFARRSDTDLWRPFRALFELPSEAVQAIPDLRYQLYSTMADAGMRRVLNSLFEPATAESFAASPSRVALFESMHRAALRLRGEDAWYGPLTYLTDLLRAPRPTLPRAALSRLGFDDLQKAAVKAALARLRTLAVIESPIVFAPHSPYDDPSPLVYCDSAGVVSAEEVDWETIGWMAVPASHSESEMRERLIELLEPIEA